MNTEAYEYSKFRNGRKKEGFCEKLQKELGNLSKFKLKYLFIFSVKLFYNFNQLLFYFITIKLS